MEKFEIRFCKDRCKTPCAHVRLYKYEDGSLELWHYSSNVLNIDNRGVLHLGDNWNYGPITARVVRSFVRQYDVEDQYEELKCSVKEVRGRLK